MGILPEALMNYLALLGWAPSGGTRETFTAQELIKEFSLERVTPSPAIFDFEKLYWLNRHYLKRADRNRLLELAAPYFQKAGLLSDGQSAATQEWISKLIELLVPYVDRLDQLPERAAMIFCYDANAAVSAEDNRALLESEEGKRVIAAFTRRVHSQSDGFSAEGFKAIINEVKNETGTKGKELFHPIRIVITGSHSGPDFDRVIPLIEAGSRLDLPQHVLSVRERVEAFEKAFSS
jgi:glutamyl-tRNA synthetase/nondiscriminating glutamyl-tRNA synthetase